MTIKCLNIFYILFFLVSVSGCASPLNKLQSSMDQMTYYMGMMASTMPQLSHNTGRLANSTERLEGRANRMASDFQQKGASAEKAIQNYTQTFIDNDRAISKNLQGIQQEISELKKGQLQAPRTDSPDQARINASINERINRLEAQIAAINAKLK